MNNIKRLMMVVLSLFAPTMATPMTTQAADDLGIEIPTQGDGEKAQIGQRVTVHYEGRLTDGTMFVCSEGASRLIYPWP